MKYRIASGFQGQDWLIMPFSLPGVLLVLSSTGQTPIPYSTWSSNATSSLKSPLTPVLDPVAPSSGIPEHFVPTSITPIICYKKYLPICLFFPALRLYAPRGRGHVFSLCLQGQSPGLAQKNLLSNKRMREADILHVVTQGNFGKGTRAGRSKLRIEDKWIPFLSFIQWVFIEHLQCVKRHTKCEKYSAA